MWNPCACSPWRTLQGHMDGCTPVVEGSWEVEDFQPGTNTPKPKAAGG